MHRCLTHRSLRSLTPTSSRPISYSTPAAQGSFSLRGAVPDGLKQGLEAPTYRPSIPPSRAAGLAPSPDGRLRLSTAAAVKGIMHQLVTDQRTLEARSPPSVLA